MDVKAKIEELVKKVTTDAELKTLFQQNPIQAVEKVLGVDLPDEQVKAIVDGVKAKLAGDAVKNAAGGAVDAIKGLLGK